MSATARWLNYDFGVFTHDASWNDVGGVYIFAGPINMNRWSALYIGQTDSFRSRIPGHEQWPPAQRAGATHVHATVVHQASERERIERELIAAYQPRLNTQLR